MAVYSYSPQEIQTVENHIIKYYGDYARTVPVKESETLNLKIYVIEPSKGRDYYTLITSGMGAYKMELPDDFRDTEIDRIELVMYLSSDWNMDIAFSNPTGLIAGGSVTPVLGNMYYKWNWPVKILKNLAQIPADNESYFVKGNIMDDEEPFSSSTNDSGVVLINPAYVSDEGMVCELPCGEKVKFLQVFPITTNEIERALNLNQSLIFHRMIFHNFIIFQDDYLYDYDDIFDDSLLYLIPLYKHNVVGQTGEKAALNHMAILLRWFIENDMLNDYFAAKYEDEVEKVKKQPANIDLRDFIINNLVGSLRYEILKEEYVDFAETYCLNNPDTGYVGQYFDDLKDYAINYFESKNESIDEMYGIEYVFVPYTEEYYQDIAKILNEYFKEWQQE